jgi:hypothetical protein
MSPGCDSNRSRIFLVLLTLALLVLLTGNAYARNPDLSNWTLNLSAGDEPDLERWDDAHQEILVVGSTVHVLWWTARYLISDRLYYRRSTDGGKTWQPKILLYDTAPNSGNRTFAGQKYMAVDGDSVHVAYAAIDSSITGFYKTKLMYRRSTNSGASFEDAQPLAGPYWWIAPTFISASGGGVTIAMTYSPSDGPEPPVATLNSANGGNTFTATIITAGGHRYIGTPINDLKRVGNRVYLLYTKDLQANEWLNWSSALYCATSLDGGAIFKVNEMTTPAASGKYLTHQIQAGNYSPNLAVDGDHVYVVWTQTDTSAEGEYYNNDNSLYIRRSTDQGQNFAAPQLLAQNRTDIIGNMVSGLETVAANGGHVYVTLLAREALGGGQYNDRVYFRRSADSGGSFSPIQELGLGWWPNMVVDPNDGAKVHVFWFFTYRYSADGGATFTNPVVLMPWAGASAPHSGAQMALGAGDTKHLVNSLKYYTPAYTWGDEDIFYRAFGPPAPSAGNQALRTYADANARRYDSMEVASSDWFNFGSRMSAEVWVKLLPGEPYWSPIFAKLPTGIAPGGSLNRLFSLGTETRWSASPHVIAELGTTDNWYVLNLWGDAAGLVAYGTWTHLAMTYDADAAGNNFKLYKNGQLINSTAATGNVATGTGNFYAGKFWEGSYGGWEMDELRLWSKALSQNEIIANMRRKLAGNEPGLNAYYQFDATTKDITGHGNDGILNYQESYVAPPNFSGATAAVNSLLAQ